MKLAEIAWAAGFIDGEGGFYTHYRDGRLHAIYCIATQIEREPLDRLVIALGVGKVYGPYNRRHQAHPQYRWQVQSYAGIKAVIDQIRPLLCSSKRRQAENLLNAWAASGKRARKAA